MLTVSGTASGQLNGNEVPFEVTGAAAIGGVTVCPFVLRGTAVIEGSDAIRIPYTGDTCLGPVHGEETLRRPAVWRSRADAIDARDTRRRARRSRPSNPYHVAAGPLDAAQAERVVRSTGNEFAHLTTPRGTSDEAIGAAEELLLRVIWHLQLAGFEAARQRNPSGAISNDKLNVAGRRALAGLRRLHGLRAAAPGRPGSSFSRCSGSNPLPYPGVPDYAAGARAL